MDGKGTEAELTHESKREKQKGLGELGKKRKTKRQESHHRALILRAAAIMGGVKVASASRASVAKPFSNNRNRL